MTPAADVPIASVEALERDCRAADRAGDIVRVHTIAERAAKEAQRDGDNALLARAQCWMAHAHLYRGALRECLMLAAQTEALASHAGDDLAKRGGRDQVREA